jgi:DNA (cytosine-5)-methyltransferase 1
VPQRPVPQRKRRNVPNREVLLHRPRWRPGRPCIADVFCCQGGIAEGYWRAGFNVIGFDIQPQPRYPFEFNQADALEVLADRDLMEQFYAIHVSPPCQHYSDLQRRTGRDYPDLVGPVRDLLEELDMPYVIENVPEAPLRDPVILCGTMFPELRVLRHRGFETNWPLEQPPHHPGRHPLVFTHDKRKAHYGQLDQDTSYVQVTGGGNCTIANAKAAMGIDWMDKHGLNEAIPPAYGEYVGRELLAYLELDMEAAA